MISLPLIGAFAFAASPPSAPSISGVNATTGVISITFSAGTGGTDVVSTYQYSLDNGATWTNRPSGTTASPMSDIPVDDASVVAGSYDGKIRIRAITLRGYISDASNAATPVHTVPGTPPTPSVSLLPYSAYLSWTASTTNAYAIAKYQISTNNSTWSDVGSTANDRAINFTSLSANTSYTRYIRAIDVQGQASTSRTVTFTTPAYVAPTTPAAPSVSPLTTTSIEVSYTGSTAGSYPISSYNYRTSTDNVNFSSWLVAPASPFTISGLSVDTVYYVQIRAVPTLGAASAASSSGSARTNPPTPSAPIINFSSTNASERANAYLSWASSTYATEYYVYKNGSFYTATTGTSASVAVSEGSSNSFYVAARNRIGGQSANSNTKYMTVGAQNVPLNINVNEFGPDVNVGNAGTCSNQNQGRLVHYFGGVPSSSTEAGWKKIEVVGYQAKAYPSTFGSTCSATRGMYIQVGTNTQGGNSGGLCFGINTTSYGLGFITGLNISGSALNNNYLILYASGSGWDTYNSSCVLPSGTAYTMAARNLYATGIQTTASSYS